MGFLDNWSQTALNSLPENYATIFNDVAQVTYYKQNRTVFRKNDFGFEQILTTYLANFFLRYLPAGYELGIAENLSNTTIESKIQPDFSLSQPNRQIIEIMEIKTITNNKFSWFKRDILKLRGLTYLSNKYFLGISLYLTARAKNQLPIHLQRFINQLNLNLINHGTIYQVNIQNHSFEFHYFLFQI